MGDDAPTRLTPARVVAVLRELQWPVEDAAERWLKHAAAAVGEVRTVPGHRPTWRIGAQEITVFDPGKPAGPRNLVCTCPGRVRCVHVAAVLLSVARADPDLRPLLEAPLWELALAPLAQRGRGDGAEDAAAHEGFVRWELLPPDVEGRLRIVPWVVRRARAEDRELAPVRYPRDGDRLRSLVRGIDREALALHDAYWTVERARELERRGDPTLTDRLTRSLVARLAGHDEVWFEGRRIAVDGTPLRPRVAARRSEDGSLTLLWEPEVTVRWQEGLVLTSGGAVHPLASDTPAAVVERVGEPLPGVPADEVDRFVDRVVVGYGLDVDLPAGVGRLRSPDGQSARVVLGEAGDTLIVRLDLAYQRAGGEAVVDLSHPAATVEVPDGGLVVRDRRWERAVRDRFARDVGARDRLELRGPAALVFLRERLDDLKSRWDVWGEDALVRLRIRGTLRPTVGFSTGEDWFDLDVRFEVDGRSIPAAPILRSWLAGERLHRLEDGTLAALPEAWLERHGRAVDELADVRRAQRKLGSWHAWMAAELLEEEVGDEALPWLQWTEPLRRFEGVPERPAPAALQAELRHYQQQGFEWLCFLRDAGLHGVLADDMGLGKTVQALAALLDTEPGKPSLVVAPTSVVPGWAAEAARFAPSLRVRVHHGPDRGETFDDADLVVTTYGLLRRDRKILAKTAWRWLILDEAQHIKNPGSKVARAARAMRSDHRLALTGTPLENHLVELWSLMAFLMPGYLGSRRSFHARYAGPAARDDEAAAISALRQRLRPFVLRRTKAQVTPELPERTDVVVKVPLGERERHLYDRVRATYRASAEGEVRDDGLRWKSLHLLDALTRLRQACCHPGLLPFPEARAMRRSSKVEALLERLLPALEGDHKALVFSQWPSLLKRVAERLDAEGVRWLLLEGATRDRGALVQTFQSDDGPPVFLISIKAGGTGLNLTAADLVFHLDPWWNPATEDQATDRAHRIGQTRPVTVYRLVAADTVEERVLALQDTKRHLFERTIEAERLDPATLTLADLEAVLGPPPA